MEACPDCGQQFVQPEGLYKHRLAVHPAEVQTECRAFGGHDWTVDRDRFGLVTMTCQRCDVQRRDQVDVTTGQLLSRRYIYPKGMKPEEALEPVAPDPAEIKAVRDSLHRMRDELRE